LWAIELLICGVTIMLWDMPDETIDDLISCIRTRYPRLVKEVKHDHSFATGARCLLKLMDEVVMPSLGLPNTRLSPLVTK